MGEQRADLAPGLPRHSLQLPRGAALPRGGTHQGAGGGQGCPEPVAATRAGCRVAAAARNRLSARSTLSRRPGRSAPPRQALPTGIPGARCPPAPREHARAGLGTRGDGVRLYHFPGGSSNIQFSGGHPGGEAFQPPGLPLNRRSRSAPGQACSCAGPGREARVIVSPRLFAFR